MIASPDNANIENIDNEISVNKKVRVEIGITNHMTSYKKYGEVIWFPCGLYVLSSANVTRNTSGWNISISGKDKMCLLDGTAGGTLPSSISFHEVEVPLKDGSIEIQHPTIYRIIYEAVTHYGGEDPGNIIISDIDDIAKKLVKYVGTNPIYFNTEYTGVSFRYRDGWIAYEKNEDIGYEETEFTYPGELILNAGDTVVTLLDKIKNTLGNFEYFYDLQGRFVFQQIKNYLNTPSNFKDLKAENYVKSYSNAKYLYDLTDFDATTAISRNPKYDNIKNDFYVWGTRKTPLGTEVAICYHVAIDTKPEMYLFNKYIWEVRETESGNFIRYEYTDEDNEPRHSGGEQYECIMNAIDLDIANYEWREELYRRAFVDQTAIGVPDSYCAAELLAFWRDLYDPEKWDDIKDEKGEPIGKDAMYWNPDVFDHPSKIKYWLDFIDDDAALAKYSIKEIGRRTKVINDSTVQTVFNTIIPDIIFIQSLDEKTKEYYVNKGQKYFQVQPQLYDLFAISSTGASCFDRIREMLYQNLSYNTSISITCLAKYYMEPNNIIHIEDKNSGINGNFLVTQFNVPLTYNGTMSITATEVLTRV